MFRTTRSMALALALGLPFAAFAQEATTTQAPADAPADTSTAAQTPADAGDLSMGQEAGGASDLYVKQTYGDWQLRCLHAKDGSDPCEIYQLLKDDKGTSVAEVTMVTLPEGEKAALGATVIVPLETLLTAQMQLALDTAKPKVYPFTFCAQIGCFSRVGFTADEFAAMKKGNKLTVSVVPVANVKQVVSVNISLKGFTDATDALKATQAAAPKP
ncbi:MAG: invasion associated locus B family protein [Proteobacteria bacterium]|nr:invasion associated locus B family protein [Pseudomonadota bacterium]